jgi:hypothetical protein
MTNKPKFDAQSPAEAGSGFIQSLLASFFRSASPAEALSQRVALSRAEVLPPAPTKPSRLPDAGADASWTASLNRGDGLPPFLLSIDMAAGARSVMRFEPFGRRDSAFGPEI